MNIYEYVQLCVYICIVYIIPKYNLLSVYMSTRLHVFRLTIGHYTSNWCAFVFGGPPTPFLAFLS